MRRYPDPIKCLLSLPASAGLPVPAEADSLDRRGAVVRVENEAWLDEVLHKSSLVEIQVGLPAQEGRDPRLMHCIGHVVSKSLDRRRCMWLLLRFSQIYVTSLDETGPGVESGQNFAFSTELMRRGDRDPTIVGGGQPAESEPFGTSRSKEKENA